MSTLILALLSVHVQPVDDIEIATSFPVAYIGSLMRYWYRSISLVSSPHVSGVDHSTLLPIVFITHIHISILPSSIIPPLTTSPSTSADTDITVPMLLYPITSIPSNVLSNPGSPKSYAFVSSSYSISIQSSVSHVSNSYICVPDANT